MYTIIDIDHSVYGNQAESFFVIFLKSAATNIWCGSKTRKKHAVSRLQWARLLRPISILLTMKGKAHVQVERGRHISTGVYSVES